MSTEQLNPSLAVEAHLLGPIDGDTRTSRFVLRHHPEMAAWLLTILDFILWKQGHYTEEKRIADPPGSETLARLVAGAVILVGQRPDGGLALRLNPGFEVGLWLSARRPGKPALTTTLALAEDPELARWLLDYFLRSDPPAPPAPGPLADSLRRHGILVNELPPPEANFPDPGLPPDPAADLSTAARLIPQGAGQGVPVDARHLLGRHTPRLPAGTAIAWAVDAGTNLVFPALTDAEAVPAPARVPGLLADVRAEAWNQQVNTAKRELEQNRYAVLREIVPPGPRAQLRHYVRQLVERGYFPALGDGQVELRSAIHNEPTIASLHLGLARIVSRFCGETVQASYCYLSCYEAGAVLLRHRDRPQCNYNLSLVLDMQGPDGEPPPWPIYLELDGRPLPVLLEVGDGLVYSGTELWHWRDALPPGQRAIVCFFHFVPGNFAGSLD